MKAKGQAFIVFASPDEAELALDSLQGFEVFERPMNIQYAKTRSDATVQKEEGEEGLEQHKRQRMAEKGETLHVPIRRASNWENTLSVVDHSNI